MNILMLGNGFDIAHNLPTQYRDFLEMISLMKGIGIAWSGEKAISISYYTTEAAKKDSQENREKILHFCNLVGNPAFVNSFKVIAEKSFWINHFLEKVEPIGDNWLDFEEEIRLYTGKIRLDMGDDSHKKITDLSDRLLNEYAKNQGFRWTDKTYYDLLKVLKDDLDSVKKALSIYMNLYVERLPVKRIGLFESKSFDKLISFNYTSTYTDNYRIPEECCYIHGNTTDKESISNNLVLGFEDYYLTNSKTITELVPFEKYYQRIVNRTDSKYYKWIETINRQKESSNLYIFGHSLSQADGDVLIKFLTNEYITTTIYYYSDDDRADKLQNLAVILGPDKLVELSSGEEPKIEWEVYKS